MKGDYSSDLENYASQFENTEILPWFLCISMYMYITNKKYI